MSPVHGDGEAERVPPLHNPADGDGPGGQGDAGFRFACGLYTLVPNALVADPVSGVLVVNGGD